MNERKRIVPNVIRGGVAIPLGANYFLMNGKTHEQGGIDIGKDLEVENGEIIKMNPKSIKVLSNAPIIDGISPAQMALGGLQDGTFVDRYNSGFNYQEKYKDINGLKDDGTKAKIGKKDNITPDKKLVEDVVRTSGGMTGSIIGRHGVDFTNLIRGIRSWRVMKGNKDKVASSDEDYTGVAIDGGKLSTDDGLGFATTNELIDRLGTNPTDFVDAYIYGKTPFEKQGVIKKEGLAEKHALRSKIAKLNRENVPVYQTHKDTIPNEYVKYLNEKLAKGDAHFKGENTTHKGSPFRIGNTGMIYDGNNSSIAQVTLPDGTVAYKALDVFDTDPNEWNYLVGPFAKKGLKFIHENSNPFLMTTPWYYKKDDRTTQERLKETFGIEYRSDGTIINTGDINGKIWNVEDALEWIDSHKYNAVIEEDKNKTFTLGGKTNMKRYKRNASSTGERKKADLGDVKPLGRTDIAHAPKTKPAVRRPIVVEPEIGFFQANPNFLSGAINAAGNIIGAGISYGINKKMLKDLKAPYAPTMLQPVSYKTNINIDPQVREIKSTVNKYIRSLKNNTASSQVYSGRVNDIRLKGSENIGSLYGEKENTETSLINQNIAQRQATIENNISKYDDWRKSVAEFENNRRELQSENANALVQNNVGAFSDFLNKNAQWRTSMANISALAAAYPDVTADLMAEKGLPYAKWLEQQKGKKGVKWYNFV